jgi:hypothetical protein
MEFVFVAPRYGEDRNPFTRNTPVNDDPDTDRTPIHFEKKFGWGTGAEILQGSREFSRVEFHQEEETSP